ncbi:MAG: hypothetical protein NDI62_00575 [Burkholderiales bacterium]|nr:hypothetical protein [Burkholderiales bacterium]
MAFMASFANAQIRNTDIVLSITPTNTLPNQNVSAKLSSYVVDLDKSNISWSIDDAEMSNGIGKKSFSFRTKESGSQLMLSVNIETADGQNLSKTMTIIPTDVDILWEAHDAYVPPFYKGKALAPSQGEFKIVPIPNIINQTGKVNTNNLSYTWKKDGKVQSISSGWGKNYFIFRNSYLDKVNNIEVKISDITGNTTAIGKINLNTTKPKILFYENDPSLGVKWEKSINDNLSINKEGGMITAEPYFFSPKDINSKQLNFDWYINKSKISTPEPKNTLSVKGEEGKSGSAAIKLIINNVDTIFQTMEKQINVSF